MILFYFYLLMKYRFWNKFEFFIYKTILMTYFVIVKCLCILHE